MKRIISLAVALVMLLSLIVCNVPSALAAKPQLEFVLTNGAGMNNEEFTIELQLKDNPGIYAFYLMIYYDTDVLILRDCKLSDEFAQIGSLLTSDSNLQADDFTGPVGQRVVESFPSYGVDTADKSMKLVEYEIDDITKNCELNGTALTLTFQVMGIAQAGDYTVGMVPDAESIINIDAEDVPFKMTNSIVRVGTTEVPAETAPTKDFDETQKVETTDTTANDIIVLDPDDTTTEATEAVTKPAETFVGEDGTTYYENEAGETVVYNESDFETKAPTEGTDKDTTAPDVGVDGNEVAEEDDGNKTILWIVVAAVLVLIGVAGVLVTFISKTKKEGKEENNENE